MERRVTRKSICLGLVFIIIAATFFMIGCIVGRQKFIHAPGIGISLPTKELTLDYEDHGGFHGDGMTYRIYQLSLEQAKSMEDKVKTIDSWRKLPLSEELSIALYGGEKGETTYGGLLDPSNGLVLPKITNGYWYFYDRYAKENVPATDPYKDSNLLKGYSENYTVAILDMDTNQIYYIEEDT